MQTKTTTLEAYKRGHKSFPFKKRKSYENP